MRRLLPALLLLAAPPLAAHTPYPPEDPDDIRKSEERVGAFRLELEEYRDTSEWATEPPREWKKVRMIWRSADGLLQSRTEDDGHALTFSFSLSTADGKGACSGGVHRLAYGPKPDARNALPGLRGFLRRCALQPAGITAYEVQFGRALADYPAAAYRMRALALAAFGQLAPRCLEFRSNPDDPILSECVRYSKPPPAAAAEPATLPPSKS